jgi:DNA-binding transcriptional LysR family regulator
MDLGLLDDFVSLAETCNFSRSAEQRNITQPAFSRRIRALELWLGTALVDRTTYPTKLTPAGRLFRGTAEEVLRVLYTAREELAGRRANVIRVAALHTLSLIFFPNWFKRVEPHLGPASCQLISDNMHNCVQALVERNCDLLLCYTHPSASTMLDPDKFESKLLGRENVLPVCVPDKNKEPLFALPGLPNAPLPLLTYAPESYLGRAMDFMIQTHTVSCHLMKRYENSFAEALKAMAVEGLGIAWLPHQSIVQELASGRLVRAGPSSWDLHLEIRLYRSVDDRKKPISDQFWLHADGGRTGT